MTRHTATPVNAFVHATVGGDVPARVRTAVRRFVLDALATGAAGAATDSGERLRAHAALHATSRDARRSARVLFDGHAVPAPGAAGTGAGLIDSVDAHDGHPLCKGHAGCAVVPAALAAWDADGADGDVGGLFTDILVGYEIALRAGIALHRTAPTYHTSGAWNALGAAAVTARRLRVSRAEVAAALGLAEFDAPRGRMMRVIDRPSMLKDGSRAGARTGVAAAEAACVGFDASPAELIESADTADLWRDLGSRWRVLEQYMKPWPVCRWAQPALAAAARVRPDIGAAGIRRIEIATFGPGARLAGHRPANADEAQYALAYPLAAYLARGRFGAAELTETALRDPDTLALSDRVTLTVADDLDRLFPEQRWCRLTVTLDDGRVLASGDARAHGDPETPLSDADLAAKTRDLAGALPADRVEALIAACLSAPDDTPARDVLDVVLAAPSSKAATRSSRMPQVGFMIRE